MTPEERAELDQRRELARQEIASQQPTTPEETSLMDKVVQGAEQFGQGVTLGFGDELSSGIRSIIPSERFGDETIPEAYERMQAVNKSRMASFVEENPEIAIPANIAGNIVSGIAAPGAKLGGRLAMAGREGALGAIEAYGTDQDVLTGAGMGTAFGGIGSLIGRPRRVAEGIEEVAQRAEARAGRRLLTRAQGSNSRTGRQIEATLETLPGASATKRTKGAFQKELNREAAASIGQNADNLSGDVLGKAHDDIGQLFKEATGGRDIKVGIKQLTSLEDTIDNIRKLPSRPDTAAKIGKNILEELRLGKITDARYQEISSDVRASLFKAQKAGDSPNMKALSAINEVLDDIVQKGLGGAELDKFKLARKMYRNFKVLTKGANTINPATGDVSGKLLFNELAKGGQGYNVQGPLGDLARLSKVPGVGDSGTASRMLLPLAGVGAVAGYTDLTGSLLGSIGAARIVDEIAQGVSSQGAATAAGAIQRGME